MITLNEKQQHTNYYQILVLYSIIDKYNYKKIAIFTQTFYGCVVLFCSNVDCFVDFYRYRYLLFVSVQQR